MNIKYIGGLINVKFLLCVIFNIVLNLITTTTKGEKKMKVADIIKKSILVIKTVKDVEVRDKLLNYFLSLYPSKELDEKRINLELLDILTESSTKDVRLGIFFREIESDLEYQRNLSHIDSQVLNYFDTKLYDSIALGIKNDFTKTWNFDIVIPYEVGYSFYPEDLAKKDNCTWFLGELKKWFDFNGMQDFIIVERENKALKISVEREYVKRILLLFGIIL